MKNLILFLLVIFSYTTIFAQHRWKVKITGTTTTVLSLASVSSGTVGGPDFSLTATSNSPATKTFSTSNTAVATVNSSTGLAHIVAAGTVTFTVTQPAITGYTSAIANQTCIISDTLITVTTNLSLSAIATHTVGDADFYVNSSSNSPGVKIYSSSNTAVATINSSTGLVHIVAAGNYTITVSQAAVTGYTSAAASATGTINANSTVTGNTYYVDPTSTQTTTNGTIYYPYKTLSAVNNAVNAGSIKGGDAIAFKCGTALTGKLDLSNHNYTAALPLKLTTYGSGNKPLLKYDVTSSVAPANRVIIYANNSSYIIVDGLNFTDPTMSTTDHTVDANVGYAIDFEGGGHNTVQNCDISLVGVGIQLASPYSAVLNNHIQNLRMVRNTPTSINANDDYGANGIVNSASYNLIDGNYIRDCWAMSYDYGYDGGSIEYFGNCSNLTVTHNICMNGIGFMEYGAPAGSGAQANNNLIAYNILINNGHEFYINTSGVDFSIKVNNLQFFNNVVIENSTDSKFQYGWLIGQSNSSTTAGIINLRNNIFYISEASAIINNALNSSNQVTHKNNIYRMASGSIPYSLDASELNVGTAAVFQDITNADPSLWNFELLSTSAAIDKGADLRSLTVGSFPLIDFYGSTINYSTNPEPGIADYILY